MKILIFLLLISTTVFSQNVFKSVSLKTWANSSDWFLVQNPSRTNTEKMTLTTLTSIADSTRKAKDDSIYYWTGLSVTTGRFVPDATTTHLQAADFTASGKDPNLKNGLFILDSVISNGGNDLWESGTNTGSIQTTLGNTVSEGIGAVAIGSRSVSEYTGSLAMSSGRIFAQSGSSQNVTLVAYITTTGAADDTLEIAGNGYIYVPEQSTMNYTIECVAVQVGGTEGTLGDSYGITVAGVIRNLSGTTSLCAGSSDTLMLSNTAAFDGGITVSADDTNDALCIIANGIADKNFYYVATVRITMVGYDKFDIED